MKAMNGYDTDATAGFFLVAAVVLFLLGCCHCERNRPLKPGRRKAPVVERYDPRPIGRLVELDRR